MPGGHTITVHDPRLDSDQEIRERCAFADRMRAELVPHDPPLDVEEMIAAERARPERHRRTSVRARDERGALVASGGCGIDPEHDDNPDVLEISIHVLPGHRRHGLATRILAELVAVAEREGRTRMFLNTFGRVPAGAAAAAAAGAVAKQEQHVNRLALAGVDRSMLETWVREGPRRAPGYDLIAFDGPCPDEHLDGYIQQVLVLNTAPRDDVEVNDFTLTADEVRERERVYAAARMEAWTLLARHTATGAYAGVHDVTWRPSQPGTVWVGLTAVDPAHRGHALGKWLKAAMTLRILDERPGVVDVRTGNADSNDAMLGINRKMGYQPMIAGTTWELAVEDAERWLAAKDLGGAAGSTG